MATQIQTQQPKRSSLFRFGFDKNSDSTNDARNLLLIVTTLITTVTFQAGVTPPGGVWQEGKDVGRAIYSSKKGPFYTFLICNTLAFSTSTLVLICLTYNFPFFIELWIAILTMFGTFAASLYAVVPDESYKFRYLIATAALPYVIRILIEACKWLIRRRRKHT